MWKSLIFLFVGIKCKLVFYMVILLVIFGAHLNEEIVVKLSENSNFCFRLLNGTTTVGCQSKKKKI